MKLLLDTHLLLWAAGRPEYLSNDARLLLEDPENLLFFSAANIWEISIKNGLGRADFKVDARVLRRNLLDNGYEELVITSEHTLFTENLKALHKDPFDRILIAQAAVEGITLITSDALVSQYSDAIIKV